MEDTTSPETEVVADSASEAVAETVTEDALQTETDGLEPEAFDDSEEIDLDGEKYKVPKKIKDSIMMQADYTRKTQEVAEQRKQVEAYKAETEQSVKFQQEHLQEHAYLMSLDQQLEQFNKLDWNAIIDTDPVQALKLQQQYQGLQGMRGQVVAKITQVQQEQFQLQQTQFAKQMESSNAELARDVPGWSLDLAKSLRSYGMEKGSFSEDDMNHAVRNPKIVKILNKAYLYDQLVAKQSAKPKAEPIKPITIIKAKTSSPSKSPENMTDVEFAKWRKGQIAKRS